MPRSKQPTDAAVAIQADIGKPEVAWLFTEGDAVLGPVTALVNNSDGISGGGWSLLDAEPATIEEVIDTNLGGTFFYTYEAPVAYPVAWKERPRRWPIRALSPDCPAGHFAMTFQSNIIPYDMIRDPVNFCR